MMIIVFDQEYFYYTDQFDTPCEEGFGDIWNQVYAYFYQISL